MSTLKQIGAVTSMSFSSLPQRSAPRLVIVIGIAGVVAVLLSVLAMATGFQKTLARPPGATIVPSCCAAAPTRSSPARSRARTR